MSPYADLLGLDERWMTDDPHDPQLRDYAGMLLVGRYRIKTLLGSGAMGSVWLAELVALKREVAVKFHDQLVPNADFEVGLKRFMREVRLLSSIGHRNVIRHHESGVTPDGLPYLIMDRLHGQTLEQRMREGEPLEVREAVEIAASLADGLEAVHHAGALHRDIKPENVFLSRDEHGDVIPLLLDFGLARLERGGGARVTRVGHTVGTPGYMAPEQARGHTKLDARVDVYALGATLYELLCGERHIEGTTPVELLVNVASDLPIPLTVWRPDLGGRLTEVLARALAIDADERFQTAGAMAAALRAAGPLYTGAVVGPRQRPPSPPTSAPSAPKAAQRRPSTDPP